MRSLRIFSYPLATHLYFTVCPTVTIDLTDCDSASEEENHNEHEDLDAGNTTSGEISNLPSLAGLILIGIKGSDGETGPRTL